MKGLLNIADIALAGQENQDIPRALAAQFINRVANRRLEVDLHSRAVALHSERIIRVLQNQLLNAAAGQHFFPSCRGRGGEGRVSILPGS